MVIDQLTLNVPLLKLNIVIVDQSTLSRLYCSILELATNWSTNGKTTYGVRHTSASHHTIVNRQMPLFLALWSHGFLAR